MDQLIERLEATYMPNALAFGGPTGLCRMGRKIGELFLVEYANSTPNEIIDAYKEINDRVWNVSENAGDGFGRAVGKFVANSFMEDES